MQDASDSFNEAVHRRRYMALDGRDDRVSHNWACGLVVGFLFWVQEISGSNPDWPLFFCFRDVVIQYDDEGVTKVTNVSCDNATGGARRDF